MTQLRAARGLLGWSKTRLAEAANVPLENLRHYEASDSADVPEADLDAMRHALEAAGVEFIDDGQPGVRMKPPAGAVPIDELNASNDE